MANTNLFVFRNPAGVLRVVENVLGGPPAAGLSTAHDLVAVYHLWEDPPGITQRSQRTSSCSTIGCFDDDEGFTVFRTLTNTGPGNQQGCGQAAYKANTLAKSLPTIEVESATGAMSVGPCWPIYEHGDGNTYNNVLDDADSEVAAHLGIASWPPAPTPVL